MSLGDQKNLDFEYIDLAFKTFSPHSVVPGVETCPGVGVGQYSGQGASRFEAELRRVSSCVLAVSVTQVLPRACLLWLH